MQETFASARHPANIAPLQLVAREVHQNSWSQLLPCVKVLTSPFSQWTPHISLALAGQRCATSVLNRATRPTSPLTARSKCPSIVIKKAWSLSYAESAYSQQLVSADLTMQQNQAHSQLLGPVSSQGCSLRLNRCRFRCFRRHICPFLLRRGPQSAK